MSEKIESIYLVDLKLEGVKKGDMGYTKYREDIIRDSIEIYGQTEDRAVTSGTIAHKIHCNCPFCSLTYLNEEELYNHIIEKHKANYSNGSFEYKFNGKLLTVDSIPDQTLYFIDGDLLVVYNLDRAPLYLEIYRENNIVDKIEISGIQLYLSKYFHDFEIDAIKLYNENESFVLTLFRNYEISKLSLQMIQNRKISLDRILDQIIRSEKNIEINDAIKMMRPTKVWNTFSPFTGDEQS